MDDPYLTEILEHWDVITKMYLAFEDLRPLVEFDVDSGRILVYGAEEYLAQLTDRTREQTKKDYRKAAAEGSLMIFVRDESKRVLRSYVFPAE